MTSEATVEIVELDEHVVDFCFGLGMALRRVLELDVSAEEYAEEEESWEALLAQFQDPAEVAA